MGLLTCIQLLMFINVFGTEQMLLLLITILMLARKQSLTGQVKETDEQKLYGNT